MFEHLDKRFREAGLDLRILKRPIADVNRDIFQMDIQRQRSKEWYRLWHGEASNRIDVPSVDRDLGQLVLRVCEPERWFRETLSKKWVPVDRVRTALRDGTHRLVRETPHAWVTNRRTAGNDRRYLCGMDERHLFIAQYRGGLSVRDAHASLKPDRLKDIERSRPGRTIRQGEWFFVPATDREKRIVSKRLNEKPHALRRRQSLGGNGRPHVADESLRVAEDFLFARGEIRHPEHKTLRLREWHRVHRNAEVTEASFGSNGVFWID